MLDAGHPLIYGTLLEPLPGAGEPSWPRPPRFPHSREAWRAQGTNICGKAAAVWLTTQLESFMLIGAEHISAYCVNFRRVRMLLWQGLCVAPLLVVIRDAPDVHIIALP